MFHWLRNRRRRRLRDRPFPAAWRKIALRNVAHYGVLPTDRQDQVQRISQVLIAEKRWEGCNGLKINEAIKVTIGVQASVMLLGIEDYYFDGVRDLLIFPGPIRPRQSRFSGEYVGPAEDAEGVAWHERVVALSWPDVLRDARQLGSGRNLVIHELTHQIDRIDGEMGGSPPLTHPQLRRQWPIVFNREFANLVRAVERGEPTLLDDYGASNEAEFFAVCAETFFDRPQDLSVQHPEIFLLLQRFFQIDPRDWSPAIDCD